MSSLRSSSPYANVDSQLETDPNAHTSLEDIDGYDSSDTYSLDQALEHIGLGRAQVKLIIICGCWWSADAMEVMLLSFLLPTIEKQWQLQGWQTAMLAASTFLGILLGSFGWGVIADKLGRRKGYLATALFTGVFGLASCFSHGFISLLILRGLLGVGIGGSPVAFSMLSEFLPKSNRGVFLIFFEAFWTVGTILEVLLAWAILPTLGWRWLLAFSSIPLWLLLACYPLLPESPRFLLISGEYDKAVEVLKSIAAQNRSSLPKHGVLERDPGGSSLNEGRGRVQELLAPGVRRLTLLLWVLWVVHAIIYYGNMLFTPKFYGSHYEESSPSSSPVPSSSSSGPRLNLYLFVLVTTIAELPGLFGAALLVERLGRKKTMAVMLGVCVSAMICLWFDPPGWSGVILLAVSRMGINGSMATLWTFTPEAYPTTLRATGLGVANALAKLATTGTPFISTALPNKYLFVTIIVFWICCFLGIVAALFLPFDTKDSVLPSSLTSFSSLREAPRRSSSDNDEEMGSQVELDMLETEESDANEYGPGKLPA